MLHWDKDECEAARLSSRNVVGLSTSKKVFKQQMTHPALASVCYLTDSGGPTLTLPITSASFATRSGRTLQGEVYCSFPRANRLLTFQGDLLHGKRFVPSQSSLAVNVVSAQHFPSTCLPIPHIILVWELAWLLGKVW